MKRWALGAGLSTLVGALLWHIFPLGTLLTITVTAGTISYHLGVRLLIGHAFDIAWSRRADRRSTGRQPAQWEQALYRRLHVRRWKKKLPTYTPALFDPTCRSWAEIADAMWQAERIHEANMVASFVPLFFSVWFGAIGAFAATSVLAAGYDLLFVVVQRYDRPRVSRLMAREQQRSGREERMGNDEIVQDHRHAHRPV